MQLRLKTTASVVLALILSGAQAQQHDLSPAGHEAIAKSPVTVATATTNNPAYLFVLSAKKAETKQLDEGYTRLSFHPSNLNQVIMFSDRPSRIVRTITDEELNELWKEGDDSFEKNPPNAVLSAKGVLPQIVTIVGIQVSKDEVFYRIKPTQPNTALSLTSELQDMVLTIDSGVSQCDLLHGKTQFECTGQSPYID